MRRLFVAVWPPEEVLDSLSSLPRPPVDGLRWTRREQWHVTLRFLGQVPEVEPVAEVLDDLRLVAPVTAVLGPATGRFDQRILHVPVAGVDAVATAVVKATATMGRPPDARPFAGHITLARVVKKRAGVDLRHLAGAAVEDRWDVTEVCLVESRLTPAGARYEVCRRHPLERSAPGSGPARRENASGPA